TAHITRGGGGINNIYETVSGHFEDLPTLKLVAIGGMDLANIIATDTRRLEAFLQGVSFEWDFKILGIDIFEKVYGGITIDDSWNLRVSANLGAEMNILDMIIGNIWAALSYNSQYSGIMGPIYMAG